MYYNDKDLHNKISNLPNALQEIVKSLDIANIIGDIGAEQDLLISEIGYVYEETANVITGKTRPENFVEAIRAKLDDENKSKAPDVAKAINEKILIPIRNSLRQISEGEGEAKNVERPITERATVPSNIQASLQTPIAKPDTNLQSAFDKNKLLAEIENPSPASLEVKTVPPPVNLPIEPTVKTESSSPLAETAIWRTMGQDIAKHGGKIEPETSPAPINRGKFGIGSAPTAMNNALRITNTVEENQLKTEDEQITKETAKPIAPIAPKPAEEKRYSPPVPPPAPSGTEEKRFDVPPVPIGTQKSDNMLDNKLTKIVRIPSERKRYVVDPYREPTE